MKFDRTERRVLGALIEKRWTTPDQYPLSLNALVAACNQKSNRDPLLVLEPFEVEGCLLSLREKGYVMQHESHSGRVPRFGERMAERMGFSRHEIAILAELMLRGPQTTGELLRRCGRMAAFASQTSLDEILHGLARRQHVEVMSRQSGQRYARYQHLLGKPEAEEDTHDEQPADSGEFAHAPAPGTPPADIPPAGPSPEAAPAPAATPAVRSPFAAPIQVSSPDPAPAPANDLHEELAQLRDEVEELRARLDRLESLWA